MAQHFANRKSVFAAISALVADGITPTILTVRTKLAGGSYLTIKRYLNEWKAESVKSDHYVSEEPELVCDALETSSHVVEKNAELGRILWAMVIHEANKQTQATKDVAKDEIFLLSQALHLAENDVLCKRKIDATLNTTLAQSTDRFFQSMENISNARIKTAEGEARQLACEVKYLHQQVHDLNAELISLKALPSKGA